MKRLIWLLLLGACFGQTTVAPNTTVFANTTLIASSAGGGVFTRTQTVSSRSAFATNYTCVTLTCTFNLDGAAGHGAATGAGHGLILYAFDGDGDNKIITGVSGGCSVAWVVQSAAHVDEPAQATLNAATCTSSASGATSIAVTFGSGTLPSSAAGILYEFAYSAASISFDAAGAVANGTSASPVGPTLTLTGTQDVVVQMLGLAAGNPTAVSSPYDTNFTITGSDGNAMAFVGTSYIMNSASGAAATWTNPSTLAITSAVAMKGN